MNRKASKHRKPGRIARAAGKVARILRRHSVIYPVGAMAALVIIAGTAGSVPAGAATLHRHGHSVAQCWPYSDRGTGDSGAVCLPTSHTLERWAYAGNNSTAWERGMHWTRCDSLAARVMRRGLVFKCRNDGFRLAGWHPVRTDKWRRALIRRLEGFYRAQPDLRRYLLRWVRQHYGAAAPASLVPYVIRWHPYTMSRVIADF